MKQLLTSGGVTNASIHHALVELLGKPIDEASALFVPTAIYPSPGGGANAMRAARGEATSPLCELGWKSLGLLELTALPTIPRESWVPALHDADALLVWGGNVLFLSYWLRKSGLAELLPTLDNVVYVGVSAGSIAVTSHNCDLESNRQRFAPESEVMLHDHRPLGLVDFTMWVHIGNPNPIFDEHTMENARQWASTVSAPTYAIDDQTAIKVVGRDVEVISEGQWDFFSPHP